MRFDSPSEGLIFDFDFSITGISSIHQLLLLTDQNEDIGCELSSLNILDLVVRISDGQRS